MANPKKIEERVKEHKRRPVQSGQPKLETIPEKKPLIVPVTSQAVEAKRKADADAKFVEDKAKAAALVAKEKKAVLQAHQASPAAARYEGKNGKEKIVVTEDLERRVIEVFLNKECTEHCMFATRYKDLLLLPEHCDIGNTYVRCNTAKFTAAPLSTFQWAKMPDYHLLVGNFKEIGKFIQGVKSFKLSATAEVGRWAWMFTKNSGILETSEALIEVPETTVGKASEVMGYAASTRVGDCGSPVIANDLTNHGRLIGIHIAGADRHSLFAKIPPDTDLECLFPNV